MGHGRKQTLSFDDDTGAPQQIEKWLRNIDLDEDGDAPEGTTMNSRGEERIDGLVGHKLSFDGISDETIDKYLYAAICAQKSFAYGPSGADTGNVKKSGECIGTSYEIVVDFEKTVDFSFGAESTGPITQGTY